jgi:hypothetical protein
MGIENLLYDLYFLDSYDYKRLVQKKVKYNDLNKVMTEYIRSLNPNYTIYYVRTWQPSDTSIMFDVGSHTEFFLAEVCDNGST